MDRRQESYNFRMEAAELARSRPHPAHEANGDEQRLAQARYGMSFTKGLEHSKTNGLIVNAADFEAFRSAVDEGYIDAFTDAVNVPTNQRRRQWEAPTAGLVFELEGPDPQAVTMSPAPALGESELCYEMAEVYELALLRDVPLTNFEEGNNQLDAAIKRLNDLTYTPDGAFGRARRTADDDGVLDAQYAFRGSSPGVEVGPYLSQFMLIGNDDRAGSFAVGEGKISYGAITIDQRVSLAKPGEDYMQKVGDWLEVQNGFEPSRAATFLSPSRFVSTPRDLATYVHFDALYEAYLNACLILLGMGTPFDPAFDHLSGGADQSLVGGGSRQRNAGGFALYGGPHILTLVTEVATRALKAVRYQKFNNHIRLRPEALAGRLHFANQIAQDYPSFGHKLNEMVTELNPVLDEVNLRNGGSKAKPNRLLPMAFVEGSPMHPAYGAGHATVAGACVTILKAFFDTSTVLLREASAKRGAKGKVRFKDHNKTDQAVEFVSDFGLGGQGCSLECRHRDKPLTLEGELNKLAANISIGRNMAGVHYFSDYYDSLRMGEEIAIALLEEQALGYGTDPFVMSVPTFDGAVRRIGRP